MVPDTFAEDEGWTSVLVWWPQFLHHQHLCNIICLQL